MKISKNILLYVIKKPTLFIKYLSQNWLLRLFPMWKFISNLLFASYT